MEQPPAVNYANYPLKDITGPHPHDVLCGRGGGTNNHVGNSHWRMLVAANKQLYVTLPKRQKMLLSRSIVNAVRSQNPPGRFLQKDAKSELWYDVGDQRAQEKTSQALREGAPDIRSKMAKGVGSTEENTKKQVSKPLNNSDQNQPQQSTVVQTQSSQTPVQSPGLMMPPQGAAFMASQTVDGSSGAGMQMPVPPPGATPVVLYATPQGMQAMQAMPGVQMYPAMMTPQGVMMPTMHTMPPPFPPPIPAQIPSQKPTSNENPKDMMTLSSSDMPPPNTVSSPAARSETNNYSDEPRHEQNNSKNGPEESTIPSVEGAEMVAGGLEPSGVSFGTISMASIDTKKLETGGTSFGSTMSFTVASSRVPDMVDGGLEPIGTSFGSLSLNTAVQLQKALQPADGKPELPKSVVKSYHTPTLLAQQRSTGNLLECSESEEEEEEFSPNQTSKSADWEKLKAMLDAHTSMESKMQSRVPSASSQQPTSFEAVPHTGFDRDFSNISAISMGEFEEFDQDLTETRKSDGLNGGNDVDIPGPPPTMPPGAPDDDSVSEREHLQLMYLARGGGVNL